MPLPTRISDTAAVWESPSVTSRAARCPPVRLSEDRPHIEGMNQALATTIFYGDTDTYHAR